MSVSNLFERIMGLQLQRREPSGLGSPTARGPRLL
jgi:hypothetical protein